MPWCEPCAKYWTPNAMNDDGTCPTCGAQVIAGEAHGGASAAVDGDDKAPWHFKLMILALTVYLGWRLVSIFV